MSAPDPLAERRFALALGYASDGDFRAAADLCAQALELNPDWAAAWFALGEAYEKLGEREAAAAAYAEAAARDPADVAGAGPRLSLLRGEPVAALPPAYVARLFDDYAPRFESHLTQTLGYRGPEAILAALDAVAPGRRYRLALDLGCGSGLMGRALRSRVERLAGVDLSAAMVAKARENGGYDDLAVGDLLAFLASREPASADLCVAADTLVYLGDLGPVFGAAKGALSPGGLFAFTVESDEDAPFQLGAGLRFQHSHAHIRAAAAQAGLSIRSLAETSTRREGGAQARGRVGVLKRT